MNVLNCHGKTEHSLTFGVVGFLVLSTVGGGFFGIPGVAGGATDPAATATCFSPWETLSTDLVMSTEDFGFKLRLIAGASP